MDLVETAAAIRAAADSVGDARGRIWGGTVTEDEARAGWTRCGYYGGCFRIVDGTVLYAVLGRKLIAGPAPHYGTLKDFDELRVYDVSAGMMESVLVMQGDLDG